LVYTIDLDRALRRADEEAGVLVTDARPELAVEVSDRGEMTFASGIAT
jgi:hypothetical protein